MSSVKRLPIDIDLETKKVLKQLVGAHRYLAELRRMVETIPNEGILLNTLTLQEAKDSSEIENIITTHDEVYKANIFSDIIKNPNAKEVENYSRALGKGFNIVKSKGLLSITGILDIHKELEQNEAGFRRQAGTILKNDMTGEVIYTPPQNYDEIIELMENLERFINDDRLSDIDPLIKMAVIHFQFETIHPFYDGNGRTGRIINILYLVLKGLLDIPVLYLSRYITQNKTDYYKLLQGVRVSNNWEDWVIFILNGIQITAMETMVLVNNIKILMQDYKYRIREALPKIYSHELLNNLFKHPYTKIEYLKDDLSITRETASKYLDKLTEAGFLKKEKIGKYNYYINEPLFELLRA